MNAQVSTTNAASSSTQKNKLMTVRAWGLTTPKAVVCRLVTEPRYLLSAGGGNWWIVPPGPAGPSASSSASVSAGASAPALEPQPPGPSGSAAIASRPGAAS